MDNTSFLVPSISCSLCCGKIKDSLTNMAGVDTVSVDMNSKTVNVSYDEHKTDASSIKDRVSKMGYEVQ